MNPKIGIDIQQIIPAIGWSATSTDEDDNHHRYPLIAWALHSDGRIKGIICKDGEVGPAEGKWVFCFGGYSQREECQIASAGGWWVKYNKRKKVMPVAFWIMNYDDAYGVVFETSGPRKIKADGSAEFFYSTASPFSTQ